MKKTAHVFIALSFVMTLCMTLMPVVSMAAGNHTPSFTWEIRNGVVFPEQWIYDGDTPLAMFDNRTSEQPGQQLMFFNRVPRPIVLRHVKLTPVGDPLIDCIQLYCKCGQFVTDRLIDLDVKGQGSDRLVVTFVTQDRFKVMTSTRVLTLTYDNERESYIYDFTGDLEFHSPEIFNGRNTAFEFTDPLVYRMSRPRRGIPRYVGKALPAMDIRG